MGFIASIQKKIGKKEKTSQKRKSKTLKFKTSLQCGGCISKVQPHLDNIGSIEAWDVKLNHADKMLKVKTNSDDAPEVESKVLEALEKEGYKGERV